MHPYIAQEFTSQRAAEAQARAGEARLAKAARKARRARRSAAQAPDAFAAQPIPDYVEGMFAAAGELPSPRVSGEHTGSSEHTGSGRRAA